MPRPLGKPRAPWRLGKRRQNNGLGRRPVQTTDRQPTEAVRPAGGRYGLHGDGRQPAAVPWQPGLHRLRPGDDGAPLPRGHSAANHGDERGLDHPGRHGSCRGGAAQHRPPGQAQGHRRHLDGAGGNTRRGHGRRFEADRGAQQGIRGNPDHPRLGPGFRGLAGDRVGQGGGRSGRNPWPSAATAASRRRGSICCRAST